MTTTSFEPITVAPFSDALAARTSELLEDTGVLSEEELATLVSRITARPDLWQPLVVVDRDRRRYELLYDDDQVDIWVLSWMPGQKTGFHDHDRSSVALICAQGELDEGSLALGLRRRARPDDAGCRPHRPGRLHPLRLACRGRAGRLDPRVLAAADLRRPVPRGLARPPPARAGARPQGARRLVDAARRKPGRGVTWLRRGVHHGVSLDVIGWRRGPTLRQRLPAGPCRRGGRGRAVRSPRTDRARGARLPTSPRDPDPCTARAGCMSELASTVSDLVGADPPIPPKGAGGRRARSRPGIPGMALEPPRLRARPGTKRSVGFMLSWFAARDSRSVAGRRRYRIFAARSSTTSRSRRPTMR